MLTGLKKWKMFLITAVMYAAIGGLNALNAGLSQMTEEQWDRLLEASFLSSRVFWILLCSVLLGFLTPIRALMNGEYQKLDK